MDQHKKMLVFRTLIGNSEVWAEVHALQSGGDGAPGRQRCSLWAYKPDHWYLQTSEAICLYTLRYHIIIFDRFCWMLSFCELCLPWHSVHYWLPPVRKCNNVRNLYELPDFWPFNSPDLNTFHYKIWGIKSTRKSTGCEWFEAASDWYGSWSGTERYWRCHRPVAQTSPGLHSSHKRTFRIFTVTYINCNKWS